MGHKPEKHLERADRIAAVALRMYQRGRISHNRAVERFKHALGHVDIYNAEAAQVVAGARAALKAHKAGAR